MGISPANRSLWYSDNFDYTEEEMEFIKAIERYQKKEKKRYLAYSEILAVAKSIGYTKPNPNGKVDNGSTATSSTTGQ
jgi:hypothetical protein